MSKFKVGDRVKNRDDYIGTITKTSNGLNAVKWDWGKETTGTRLIWEDAELEAVETDRTETVVSVSSTQITRDTLTIRDQFAMAALTGMISSEGNLVDEGCAFYTPSNAAERAYFFADAMLEARKVKA